MPATPTRCRAVILVKALPQPSRRYGETVCCAGVTADGVWKRLYPVRYRQLSGIASFSRWDWVTFGYGPPRSDKRSESCHVFEDTIVVETQLPIGERSRLLEPLIVGSAAHAASLGQSLALVRPRNTKFSWRRKPAAVIDGERETYRYAARQMSMLDKELLELEPSPFEFVFRFEDDDGRHVYRNGDWEAHAMFYRERQRRGEAAALAWMDRTFNQDYPSRGMVFAIGNQAKRPQVWQLLGVIRLDESRQTELGL